MARKSYPTHLNDMAWEILAELIPSAKSRGQVMWVDSGYDGDKFALAVCLMIQAHIEVIRHTEQEFQILSKR